MQNNFYVIAFGLSAGGLEPLKQIILHLPAGLSAAIVVIPHVPANVPSQLDRIITKVTNMEVVKVNQTTALTPDTIFVMPEGKFMTVDQQQLKLRERQPYEKINKAIDIFFKSMAESLKERSIGVILSGGGYDGIEGAKLVEHYKGIIIVQDPETAQFPMMPSGLIANDHPDYVLTPEDIVTKLRDRVSTSRHF